MPFNSVYSKTDKINLTRTGNTLVLNGAANVTFFPVYMSLNTTLVAGAGFPGGTTTDWRYNSSSAVLNIPAGSTVDFAILQWFVTAGGYTGQDGTPINTTTATTTPVSFITPSGTNSILPNPTYSIDFAYVSTNYIRAADVTTIVASAGPGTYAVQGVLATGSGLAYNKVGTSWILFVVYKQDSLPYRTVNLYSCDNYDGIVGTLNNFKVGSPIYSRLHVANVFGEPNVGDNFVFNGSLVSDPSHPTGNFNAGIIADTNGNLDTSGSFGTANNAIGSAITPTVNYARQSLDLATIDVSPQLTVGASSATDYISGGIDINVMQGLVTSVDQPSVTVVKSVNKTVGLVNDVFTYTVTITNSSNTIPLTGITLYDTLSSGITFNSGSVVLTPGGAQPLADPTSLPGISMASIAVGSSIVVKYTGTATGALLDPTPSPNTANVSYGAVLVPTASVPANHTITGSIVSNTVNVYIAQIGTTISKSVDKTEAAIGDTLVYTIVFKNTGGSSIGPVTIVDTVPNQLSYSTGTVKVNSIPNISADPNAGINLGTLPGFSTTTITFNAVVKANAPGTTIVNNSFARYIYTINGVTFPGTTIVSNSVTTTLSYATIAINKIQSINYADLGTTLTYSLGVFNNGNVAAYNVTITDTTPISLAFIPGTVQLNGVTLPSANPNTGINIGSVAAQNSSVLTFNVTVANLPPGGTTPNTAVGAFSYTVSNSTYSGTSTSNTTTLTVSNASIAMSKSVNPTNAALGTTITYTITLTNNGNSAANSVFFIDTIPSQLSFNTGSVYIGGSLNASANPTTGLTIPSIAAASSTTISFSAVVSTIPTSGSTINNTSSSTFKYTIDPSLPNGVTRTAQSNTIPLTIGVANINMTKSVNNSYADIGTTLVYTIVLQNNGNYPASNVLFIDSIPNGLGFISNSFSINNIIVNGADPQVGVNINTIAAGTTTTIVFSTTVTQIPNPNPIINSSSVSYGYAIGSSNFTGSNTSNTIPTEVNNGFVSPLTKSATAYSSVNQIVTYTITIPNIGNVTITSVTITDIIPSNTTLVAGSVQVNGSNASGTPSTGIIVGPIAAGSSSTVTFDVLVLTLPSPNPMVNNATVKYQYTVNPSNPGAVGNTTISNNAATTINYADLIGSSNGNFVKSVDKAYAQVGDTLTYTVTITNTGSSTATNVVFKDILPIETTYVNGSLTVNGGPGLGTLSTGVTIPNINPNQSALVIFKALVSTIPAVNPLANAASIAYNFTIDPSIPNGGSGGGSTNFALTSINYATLAATKTTDKNNADIGSILTYTVSITNNGNAAATNIIINDSIPFGTAFVANSVFIGGTNQPSFNPSSISVGTIAAGSTQFITYKVTITTLPNPSTIVNNATISYSYTIDPANPNGESGKLLTNNALTQTNHAFISMVKSVNPSDATTGSIITYTVTLTNSGNVAANNVFFLDTIPSELSFNTGSVSIGGSGNSSANPTTGITIPTIAANSSTAVIFTATVNSIPNSGTIVNNTSTSTYVYTVDLLNDTKSTAQSNTIPLNVGLATIVMTKSVDKNYGDLGDNITYTIALKNTGNVSANNVIFTDSIPVGTNFVSNSFTINGSTQNGLNPAFGINIGSIAPSATTTVAFKVLVVSIPSPNPTTNNASTNYGYTVGLSGFTGSSNSNTVTTQINHGEVNPLTKSAPIYGTVGDTISYRITIPNIGNVPINPVTLFDTIPNNTTVIASSIKVNGSPASGLPISGINVGQIAAGSSSVVTFDLLVVSIPNPNPMINNARVNYQYTVSTTNPNGASGSTISNNAPTTINFADLIGSNNANFTKSVDKLFAQVGDTLNYSINILNSGNVAASNIIVVDSIPNGTNYVNGSLTVNGGSAVGTPSSGITVPAIPAGQSSLIKFQVIVVTTPSPNPLANNASITYNFTIDPANPNSGVGKGSTNTVLTTVNFATISATKTVDKTVADIGDVITYTLAITNSGNTDANTVIITDSLPNGTTFVTGSVFVGGINQPSATPSSIAVGSILPSATTFVSYKATVSTIPLINPLVNIADISYKFTVNPSNPNGQSGSTETTNAITQINNAKIIATKSSNLNYFAIGDDVIYTVTLTNTGNINADNVSLKDVLPAQLQFTTGTVLIDGISYSSYDPIAGFTIGPITPNQTVVINYTTKVISNPTSNPVTNTVNINYNYTVNSTVSKTTTATDSINIFTPIVTVTKAQDKAFGSIGTVVTYSFTIANTGNTAVNNFILQDSLNSNLAFLAGSVFVNSVNQSTADPNAGISVPSIAANGTATVSFKATIISSNNFNPIPNLGNYNYNFTVDPQAPNARQQFGTTNTVNLQVNYADLLTGFTKSVDKQYADVNDLLTYSFNITNSGNTTGNSVVILDSIPAGTTYVNGSLTGNVPVFGSPSTGINLTAGLAPGQTATVSYQVKVTTIPSTNPIPNTANLSYRYTSDPSNPNGNSNSGNSNTVTTKINHADLISTGNFTKLVNNQYADIGDELLYTISLINTGNTIANNVVITDPIPTGTSYVAGSLIVSAPSSGTPDSGITITNGIAPNQSVTILFKVLVTELPSINPILNSATVNYSYSSNPATPNSQNATGSTNTVSTQVNHGEILPQNAIKTASKTASAIGDTVTYTVIATNTGNVPLTNVKILDALPVGTTFVVGTVKINSVPAPSEDPTSGINVGTIAAGKIVQVSFDAKVLTNTPDILTNVANIEYSYSVNPSNPPITKDILTNTVNVSVLRPNLTIVKSSNRTGALVGDIITYSITATNDGELPLTNIVIKDLLSSNLLFNGNLTLNGSPVSGDPNTGVSIGNLAVSAVKTLSFDAKVLSVPTDKIINNIASANYSFVVSNSTLTNTTTSNNLAVTIYSPKLDMTKVASRTAVKVGDSFTYTITLKNTGDIKLDNVIVTDTVPSVLIVTNITVDGINNSGDIANGINIGTLAIGQSKTIILTVKVIAWTSNKIYNTAFGKAEVETNVIKVASNSEEFIFLSSIESFAVSTIDIITASATDVIGVQIYNPQLTLTKSIDKSYAIVGETVIYTITATNTGNLPLGTDPASPVTIFDLLNSELDFIQGSVIINSVSYPNAVISNQIPLGTLNPGDSSIITFQAKVISAINNPIDNQAESSFGFQVPGYPPEFGTAVSNIVPLTASAATATVTKTADKNFVVLNGTITYTVIVQNTGGLNLFNVIFKDSLPQSVTLVDGSFSINGVTINYVDINNSINIGSIAPGEQTIIKYTVKVNNLNCSLEIINSAQVSFYYKLQDGMVGTGSSELTTASTAKVTVGINNFKQLSLEETLAIPSYKPDIETITELNGDISIVKTHIITTTKALSNEGQNLTGYKLMVYGNLNLVVEYTALDTEQSLHSAHYKIPFSSFIILQQNYLSCGKLEITGLLEDAYFKQLDLRNFFTNLTILLKANFVKSSNKN